MLFFLIGCSIYYCKHCSCLNCRKAFARTWFSCVSPSAISIRQSNGNSRRWNTWKSGCASAGYTRCPGRTSVYWCASSLHSIAVPQDFCSPLEWSRWPRIRWCGTGEFLEQGQCFFVGRSCTIPTVVFYYFSLSLLPVFRFVLWGWGLRTERVFITLSQLCTAVLF